MSISFSSFLPAFSGLFLPNGRDLDGADKIILPDSVLRELLTRFGERPLPTPLIFEVTNVEIGRISHCGVLEFTAPQHAAFLPNWMLENLLLHDGANVRLRLRSLPKLTFVKLQPTQYAFTQIANPKAALEEALHSFTALTRGDTIMIRHHNETFSLNVTEVGPSSKREPAAGCVVDAVVEVDFDAPLEAPPKEEVIEVIELDISESGHVLADQFAYYRVKVADPEMALRFELTSNTPNSHPDIYISTKIQKPSPTQQSWSGSVEQPVVIEPSDSKFSSSWFYIAVHSYGAPVAFALLATQVEPTQRLGKSLGQLQSPAVEDPNSVHCSNCLRHIPKASYSMHSIMCARNNWACEKCGKVMPRRERDNHFHCATCNAVVAQRDMKKHMDLFHTKTTCRCGIELDAMLMPRHELEECIFRLQECCYCDQKVPLNQKEDHEMTCGSRTLPCELCSVPVPRRRMDIHMAAEHRVNPCIDASGNRRTRANNDADRQDPGLAAALAASMGSDNADTSMEMNEDTALARALMESQQQNPDAELEAAIAASLSAPAPIPEPQPQPVLEPELEAAIAASFSTPASVPEPQPQPAEVADVDAELQAAIAASLQDPTASGPPEFDAEMEAAIAASLRETAVQSDWDMEHDVWE